MTTTLAVKLGLFIRPRDIGVEKIDDSTLKIYNMVIAGILIQNKLGKFDFSKKLFY